MVYNYRKVSRRAVPLNSTTFYNFDPSTRVGKKTGAVHEYQCVISRFSLNVSHCDVMGGGQLLKALAEICHII